MAQGPCLNPNCKSQGQPHPNCQCYAGMASGGMAGDFCDSNQSHMPECQYFAEGGMAFDPEAFLASSPAPSASATTQGGFDPDAFLAEPVSESQKADAAQANEDALQSKYGGVGQQAIAGIEAAGHGLAGPLATGAERLLGVKPEDIRGREEANPITHTIGEIAGLASPVGQSALLGKAGAGALTLAEKAVPRIVESGILAGAARGAVKLATESAVYQAGDEVSKLLKEDPNQSVASAISNIGFATVIGAAGGSALGSISPLWKATVGEKASQMLSDFKARVAEHLDIPLAEEAVSQGPRQVYDPFTKSQREIEPQMLRDVSPSTPKFDPFTKETIPNSSTRIEPEMKPLSDTVGGKLADMFIKHSDEVGAKALAASIGSAVGMLKHIPYGGTIGAVIGERVLSPLLESILPAITKPILEKIASGEGFKVATDYGMAVMKGQQMADHAASSLFKAGQKTIPDHLQPSERARTQLQKSLSQFQQDPASLADIGGEIGHYLPNHAAALGMTAQRVVSFLNQIKPNSSPKLPLDPPLKPSQAVQAQYERALDIANQPLVVMQAMKDGTLTSHDIIAIQTMYPDLYQGLKQKVMDQMVTAQSKADEGDVAIPYKTRLSLSLFLGQPLDTTMSPTGISAAQPMPSQPPNSPVAASGPQGAGRPTQLKGKSSQMAFTGDQNAEAIASSNRKA